MEKISFETKELSPECEVKVALGVAISKDLTGKGTSFAVEMKKDDEIKDVEVPIFCVKGAFDMVRPHLHALLDEWLDQYEYSQGCQDVNLRRKEIKDTHPEDGKPLVWSPKQKKNEE